MYEYRNIDTDARLRRFAKIYHSEELALEEVKRIANLEGYSDREVELAVNDYYLVHIRPQIMIWNYLVPVSACVMIVMSFLRVILRS